MKTRPGKDHPELSTLHGHWTAEAEQAGWSSDQLLASVRAAAVSVGIQPPVSEESVIAATLAQTLAQTLAHSAGSDRQAPSGTEGVLPTISPAQFDPASDERVAFAAVRTVGQRRAVFSRADVAGQVATTLPTTGRSAAQVVAEVERLTTVAVGLRETVSVGDHPHGVTPRVSDARYATQQVLTAEGRILALADRGRRGGYGEDLGE